MREHGEYKYSIESCEEYPERNKQVSLIKELGHLLA
jgi:hypothetical protein